MVYSPLDCSRDRFREACSGLWAMRIYWEFASWAIEHCSINEKFLGYSAWVSFGRLDRTKTVLLVTQVERL
jgi:hypothetical protein